MTERVSKSAFNQLFREMQEIRKRVFNGIPADIRREVKEELKELRDEVRKEYQGTRKCSHFDCDTAFVWRNNC